MPIQFRCSGCGQPIEVDDEHAGKMAACPYCHRVVAVPQTSTFDTIPVTPARPISPAEIGPAKFPEPDSSESLAADDRTRSARKYATAALICIGLALILAVLTNYISAPLVERLNHMAASQPNSNSNPLTSRDLQTEIMREAQNHPEIFVVGAVLVILPPISLALAITSLVQRSRGNARGIVALILSVLIMLYICGGAVIGALIGATAQ